MNPVELGQGTFPLSEAATNRFAVMINVGYLPPEEEAKLVNFDFKHVRLNALMAKERIIALRSTINAEVFLHERLGTYIQQLVAATRPYNPDTDWLRHSPRSWSSAAWTAGHLPTSDHRVGPAGQGVGAAGPRPRRGLPRGHPDLAPYILSHRIWLGPHAASHGLTAELVVKDVVARVPIP